MAAIPVTDAQAALSAWSACFGTFSDCVLAVGEQEFGAPSALLAAWSPVFDAMFKHNFVERAEKRVRIADFSPQAVGTFLRFLSSGSCQAPPEGHIEIAALADKYGVGPLSRLCRRLVEGALAPQTACRFLQVAHAVGSTDFAEDCKMVIFRSGKDALRDGHALDPELLGAVLSDQRLCITHFDLAEVLLGWGKSAKKDLDIPGLLAKHVHLCSLTAEQRRTLRSAAEEAGQADVVAVLEEEGGPKNRSEYTEDALGSLWRKYIDLYPGSNPQRPPFLGFWVNLIPSTATLCMQGSSSEQYRCDALERIASSRDGAYYYYNLSRDQHLRWMLPHHMLCVTGFRVTAAGRARVEVSASSDGAAWTSLGVACVSSEEKAVDVASKGPAWYRWFKLHSLEGTCKSTLRLRGMLLEK